MELVRQWVINIAVTLVFMTAVEMLVVENSFKKYVKFVLGLILIVVVITPIITVVTKSENNIIDSFMNYEKEIEIEKNSTNTVDEGESTKKKIVENLQNNINSLLEKEFGNYDFESEVEGNIDLDKFDIKISSINIYVYSNGIKPIKKIEIGSSKPVEKTKIKESDEIKKHLSKELEIEASKINVYSIK